MSYPNSDLSAWQLALIALVVAVSMASWLILVYRAAREPRQQSASPSAAPELPAQLSSQPNPGRRQHDQAEAA
jgi:hypothetical protein